MKSFHNKSFESFFISIFHDASRLQNFTMNLMKKDSFVSSKMIFSLMLTARKVSFNFISEAMRSFADRARTIINFQSMFDSIDFLLLVSLAAFLLLIASLNNDIGCRRDTFSLIEHLYSVRWERNY